MSKDTFIFSEDDQTQLELELDDTITMNDTFSIKLDDLVTTAGSSDSILTTGLGTSPTWSIGAGSGLSTAITGGYTITGAAGQPSYTYDTITLSDTYNQKTLKVNGDAEIDGDLTFKGKSLSETLEKLEERLAILRPNPELEDKWEELKDLGKRYRELEKEILEKEKMWDILKK